MSDLPHPVRVARESVGLTRAELAISTGISTRMIRAVELGERRPSTRTSEAIERGLLRAALARLDSLEAAIFAIAALEEAVDTEQVAP